MASTWIVVADNSRARFFSAEKSASPLQEIKDMTHPEARLHEGDLVSDRPGRDRNAAAGGSHGFGRQDEHKQDGVDKFAAEVCSQLENARSAGAFKKLYVVAAPAFLGMMRKHQTPSIRQMVAGEIDKNLASQDPNEIRRHLPEYL